MGYEFWNFGMLGVMLFGLEYFGWMGDFVGYDVFYDWVWKCLVKLESCLVCGKCKLFDLFNISGEYYRKIFDW